MKLKRCTSAVRPRLQRCEAMPLGCRPRAGGDPYAAARGCGRAGDNRKLGGYGSPPARGRQRLGLCQGYFSTLVPAPVLAKAGMRGNERLGADRFEPEEAQ